MINDLEHQRSKETEVSVAHSEWKDKVVEASRKWVKCKGRYHSEINTKALIELFEMEPEK